MHKSYRRLTAKWIEIGCESKYKKNSVIRLYVYLNKYTYNII